MAVGIVPDGALEKEIVESLVEFRILTFSLLTAAEEGCPRQLKRTATNNLKCE